MFYAVTEKQYGSTFGCSWKELTFPLSISPMSYHVCARTLPQEKESDHLTKALLGS